MSGLTSFQPSNPARFEAAWQRFDEENARDPNRVTVDGRSCPREGIYAQWLSDWVLKLAPDASEELRLAARSQHLCRWLMPRSSYPMTKAGYLRWRADLKKMHAQKAADILREVGYPEATVLRVQALNLKRDFPQDPESRVLEDALCLVFLEQQFLELASKTPDDKMISVLQKAWGKMTPAAHALALTLPYSASQKALLDRALNSAL